MNETLIIIGVTIGAFIGTNLDNLFLLAAMYSRYARHAMMVTCGYLTGMVLVAGITILVGELGDMIPLAYLGLLGLIPMLMGVLALWKLFRENQPDENTGIASAASRLSVFFALLTIQLSNSMDSILTFSVLFADSATEADYLVAPTFFAMTIVFSGLAYYSVKHPRLSGVLSRYGRYITPFILILVGYYILSDTASDLVP